MSAAFSAVFGMILGLVMNQYMCQAMRPPEKTVERVIICLKCASENPAEYNFCGNCGSAFNKIDASKAHAIDR